MQTHITNTPISARPYQGGKNSRKNGKGTFIQQVFLDADCRFQAPGLIKLCADNDIKVEEKEVGTLVVFINTARDKFRKILVCDGTAFPYVVSRNIPPHNRGQKFDLAIIQEFPAIFGATGKIDVQEAMKRALEKKLGRVH